MITRYALLPALFVNIMLHAQDGTPDPSFGTNGLVLSDAGKSDIVRDITLQADGRILAAGWTYDDTRTDMLVARFTSAGVLDPTFSNDGLGIIATGDAFSGAEAVEVQADGKVLVAGYSNNGVNNGFTVWRFNADGTVDAGFGTFGVYTDFSFAEGSFVTDMALQDDGRIVLIGPAFMGNGSVLVERLNANGTLDATFNSGGRLRYPATDPVEAQWMPNCMQVLSDGRIVVAGSTEVNGDWDGFVMRTTASGQLDATFNGNGVRVIDSGNRSYVHNLLVRPDGRYVMTGETLFNGSYDVLFLQVDAAGANSNFTGTNEWSVNHGATEYCRGSALQADGKIIAAGSSLPFSGSDAYVMRTVANSEGTDAGFGTNGWTYGDFGDWTYVEDMLVQPDGKVLIAGNSASGGASYDMMLARYIVDGTAGMDDTDDNARLSLFPLPNEGRFTLTGTHAGGSLVMRDAQGREVHAQRTAEGRTNVDVRVPAGLYSVDIRSDNARRTLRCMVR